MCHTIIESVIKKIIESVNTCCILVSRHCMHTLSESLGWLSGVFCADDLCQNGASFSDDTAAGFACESADR